MTHSVAANTQYADTNENFLVNLGPLALFPEARLSTSSNKHLAKFENLHTVSLMHKRVTSCDNSTDLLYAFDSNITRRRHELQLIEKQDKNEVFRIE